MKITKSSKASKKKTVASAKGSTLSSPFHLSRRSVLIIAVIFALVGGALIFATKAAPDPRLAKTFFYDSTGVTHPQGQIVPDGGFNVWTNNVNTSYPQMVWAGPGGTFTYHTNDTGRLMACFRVRDMGSFLFNIPSTATFDIWADNTVLATTPVTTLGSGYNGYADACVTSPPLQDGKTYSTVEYRETVNSGAVYTLAVTISGIDPAYDPGTGNPPAPSPPQDPAPTPQTAAYTSTDGVLWWRGWGFCYQSPDGNVNNTIGTGTPQEHKETDPAKCAAYNALPPPADIATAGPWIKGPGFCYQSKTGSVNGAPYQTNAVFCNAVHAIDLSQLKAFLAYTGNCGDAYNQMPCSSGVLNEIDDWNFSHAYTELGATGWCISDHESKNSGMYQAMNADGNASGLFQFQRGTWGDFYGYVNARDAPSDVQWQRFFNQWYGGGASAWTGDTDSWTAWNNCPHP